jgi:hypothetical protein
MPEEEPLITEVLAAVAALQMKLVRKVLELRGSFPGLEPRAIEYELDFADGAAGRDERARLGVSETDLRASGAFESVAIVGSIDAHLPGTEGVVWDITLERRGASWMVHRSLYAYVAADRSEYYEGRRQIDADFPDVGVRSSRELSSVLGELTDELLSAEIPDLS